MAQVEVVEKPKRPDITQAQIVSIAAWIISQAVAWGWIDNEESKLALSAASSLIAVGWMIADAYLRGKRNQAVAAEAHGRERI
jgi:hypothetical protein